MSAEEDKNFSSIVANSLEHHELTAQLADYQDTVVDFSPENDWANINTPHPQDEQPDEHHELRDDIPEDHDFEQQPAAATEQVEEAATTTTEQVEDASTTTEQAEEASAAAPPPPPPRPAALPPLPPPRKHTVSPEGEVQFSCYPFEHFGIGYCYDDRGGGLVF